MRVLDSVALAFASLWPLGRVPLAPGTLGSALAAVLAPFLLLPLSYGARALVLAGLCILGVLAAGRAEKLMGRSDPGQVVVDELAGQWLTYFPFAVLRPLELLAGFMLFRIFDILKPWPVRASERWFQGGLGIMADDLLAAVYAACCLWGLRLLR